MTFSFLLIIKLKPASNKHSNFEVGQLVQSSYSNGLCGLVVDESPLPRTALSPEQCSREIPSLVLRGAQEELTYLDKARAG